MRANSRSLLGALLLALFASGVAQADEDQTHRESETPVEDTSPTWTVEEVDSFRHSLRRYRHIWPTMDRVGRAWPAFDPRDSLEGLVREAEEVLAQIRPVDLSQWLSYAQDPEDNQDTGVIDDPGD